MDHDLCRFCDNWLNNAGSPRCEPTLCLQRKCPFNKKEKKMNQELKTVTAEEIKNLKPVKEGEVLFVQTEEQFPEVKEGEKEIAKPTLH